MTFLRRVVLALVIATLAVVSGAGAASAAGPSPSAGCPWWGCVVN